MSSSRDNANNETKFEVAKNIGKKVTQAKQDNTLTSEELAQDTLYSYSTLRQIERGVAVPSIEGFIDLFQALKVTPTFLLADYVDFKSLPEREAVLARFDALNKEQQKQFIRMLDAMFE